MCGRFYRKIRKIWLDGRSDSFNEVEMRKNTFHQVEQRRLPEFGKLFDLVSEIRIQFQIKEKNFTESALPNLESANSSLFYFRENGQQTDCCQRCWKSY